LLIYENRGIITQI